jgi:hypothetical protein
MADDKEPSGAQKLLGDFAPALVGFTDDVLFGQVWTRPQLSPKDRSLVTVACLTTSGNTDQLVYRLRSALRRHRIPGPLVPRRLRDRTLRCRGGAGPAATERDRGRRGRRADG